MITRRLATALGAGGTRSVTVAPEAGSERLRRVINKNLTEAEILRAAEWLVGGGVDALKLYVMVGLPTETDEDVDAIVGLVERLSTDVDVVVSGHTHAAYICRIGDRLVTRAGSFGRVDGRLGRVERQAAGGHADCREMIVTRPQGGCKRAVLQRPVGAIPGVTPTRYKDETARHPGR